MSHRYSLTNKGSTVQTTDAETKSAPERKRKTAQPVSASNFPPAGNDDLARMGRRISKRAKHLHCEVCGGAQWIVMGEPGKSMPMIPNAGWQLGFPMIAYVCKDCCFVRFFSVGWLSQVEAS